MDLRRCLLLSSLLCVSACNVALTAFRVPVEATAGGVFVVEVQASITNTTNSGGAACVLQLPAGFRVIGTLNNTSYAAVRDDPALLGAYTAEPGFTLASFHALGHKRGGIPSSVLLRVVLQAGSGFGPRTLKVALAGGGPSYGGYGTSLPWTPQDPPTGQFAAIQSVAHVRTINLVPAAEGDFVLDTAGLPVDERYRYGVAAGDIDGDGHDDLISSSSNGGTRTWLSRPRALPGPLANSWLERSQGLAPGSGSDLGVACADVDGDGFADVVDGSGAIYYGDGGRTWTRGTLPIAPTIAYLGVAVGDIDGDGDQDIVLGNGGPTGVWTTLRNVGNRAFSAASVTLGVFDAEAILLFDVDGDGHLDLVMARGVFPSAVLWGDGAGSWPVATVLTMTARDVVSTDLDGDGAPELVFSGVGLTVLRHAGGRVLTPVSGTGLPDASAQMGYQALAALDFDRDGDIDILATRAEAGVFELWRNDGTGRMTLHDGDLLPLPFQLYYSRLVVGDFNGDTFPDFATSISRVGVFAVLNRYAAVVPFGDGCRGPGIGTPELASVGPARPGYRGFALTLSARFGGPPAAVWLDFDRTEFAGTRLPVDLGVLGAPRCQLLVGPAMRFTGALAADGSALFRLPVPPDPTLSRQTVFAQGAVLGPFNALGAVFSRGLAIRFE